ncbi:hypothetical protein COOONC_04346 [Cooperia oncophora]
MLRGTKGFFVVKVSRITFKEKKPKRNPPRNLEQQHTDPPTVVPPSHSGGAGYNKGPYYTGTCYYPSQPKPLSSPPPSLDIPSPVAPPRKDPADGALDSPVHFKVVKGECGRGSPPKGNRDVPPGYPALPFTDSPRQPVPPKGYCEIVCPGYHPDGRYDEVPESPPRGKGDCGRVPNRRPDDCSSPPNATRPVPSPTDIPDQVPSPGGPDLPLCRCHLERNVLLSKMPGRVTQIVCRRVTSFFTTSHKKSGTECSRNSRESFSCCTGMQTVM